MTDYATLYFLPWMRRGLARALAEAADADGVPRSEIGTVDAAVTVGSTEITRAVAVRGPGAVVGLAPSQIVRQEPKAGTIDHETNYFPFVELLSPDLPWQFTPAAPHADRLLPWLVLVVVEEREGVRLRTSTGPLPVLQIDDRAHEELPPLREAWAWTHVHASVDPGDDVDARFDERPEAFVARLMCPRVLQVRTWYRACLVPAFESGRQAGLGQAVTADATVLAWSDTTPSIELPVLYEWRFRTSAEPGDFESLVRKLTARTLDDGVGVHDLDVGDPGSERLPYAPGTIVGFQGALVSPNVRTPPWDPDHERDFRRGLRRMLIEALAADEHDPPEDDYDALRDDPVVAPPAYGALPAGVDKVPRDGAPASDERPVWLGPVNLEPPNRSAAGLGAEVVRRNQESLVASAWDQAAAVREVNRTLNHSRLALEVGKRLKLRVDAMEPGTRIQFSRGAHARLKRSDMSTTLQGRVRESALPNGLVSGAFRRRVRSGTTIDRASTSSQTPGVLTTNICSGLTEQFVEDPIAKLDYAKLTVPYGTVYESGVVEVPEGSVSEVFAELDLGTLVGTTVGDLSIRMRTTAPRGGLSTEGRRLRTMVPTEATTTPTTPTRVGASVSTPSDPSRSTRASARRAADPDLDTSLADAFEGSRWSSTVPITVDEGGEDALSLTELAQVVSDKLDPAALLRVRVRSVVAAPEEAWTDEAVPASMQFSPEYPQASYELLVKIDPELLMPGVGTIPDDTVAVAKLNPAFVESFLLGANHELGREFVWREVPVDPADTWMRTFWDSVGAGAEDIERVAAWDDTETLGYHQPPGGIDPDQVLVLVIKGDLLRRYPNTLIYAVPGRWDEDVDEGAGTSTWERVEDSDAAPLWPSFVGSLGKGVVFLGFAFPADVDVELDVPGSADRQDARPGWFFVFEQPPTEPRFGLDVGRPDHTGTGFDYWKNVSWYHAMGTAEWTRTHVPLETLADITYPYDETDEDREGENDWLETWGRDAAGQARITLQRPVRMLVHADQMLEPDDEDPTEDPSGNAEGEG